MAIRLQRYFAQSNKEYGKFIPFLKEQGLDKFCLDVIPLDFAIIFKPELILEQYFLLNPSFNLNVSKVVNVPAFVSKMLYMYNRDKT